MDTGERNWELDPHQKVCCLVCTHISRPQDGQCREPGSLGACLLPSSLVPYALPAWLLMPLHLQGGLYFSQERLPPEGPEEPQPPSLAPGLLSHQH